MKKSKSTETEKMIAAFSGLQVDTPFGKITYRPEDHQSTMGGYVGRTKNEVGEAALKVHHNKAEGKIGVLCLAPEAGLGITDPAKREAIGEDKITLYQRHARGEL